MNTTTEQPTKVKSMTRLAIQKRLQISEHVLRREMIRLGIFHSNKLSVAETEKIINAWERNIF